MPDSSAPLFTACGDKIDTPLRYPRVLYQGREVLLYSVDCLKQFQRDPQAFMAGEVIHTNSHKRTQTLPSATDRLCPPGGAGK